MQTRAFLQARLLHRYTWKSTRTITRDPFVDPRVDSDEIREPYYNFESEMKKYNSLSSTRDAGRSERKESGQANESDRNFEGRQLAVVGRFENVTPATIRSINYREGAALVSRDSGNSLSAGLVKISACPVHASRNFEFDSASSPFRH